MINSIAMCTIKKKMNGDWRVHIQIMKNIGKHSE